MIKFCIIKKCGSFTPLYTKFLILSSHESLCDFNSNVLCSDIDLVVDGSLGSLPLFDLHRALINKGYADPASSQVIAKAKVSYLCF